MMWATYKFNELGQAFDVACKLTREDAFSAAILTPDLQFGRVSADGMFIEVDR